MHNRSHFVSRQDCLFGLACYDQINQADADRFQIPNGISCKYKECGAPSNSESAREQWERCWDDSALDFLKESPRVILPPCVPNLMAREVLPAFARYNVIAAKITDIGGFLSFNPSKLDKWRQRYGIPRRTTVLIHQESLDKVQEKIASVIESGKFFDLARRLGSNLIFGAPGYSVYDDDSMCPIKQVANLRTSLLPAALANRAGLLSIPTIGWNKSRPRDIEFIAEWLRRQGSKVNTLAVNAQTGTHSTKLCEELTEGILEIERQASREFHWVVFGGRKRIETIVQAIPRDRITQVSRPKDFQIPLVARDGSMKVQYLFDLHVADVKGQRLGSSRS